MSDFNRNCKRQARGFRFFDLTPQPIDLILSDVALGMNHRLDHSTTITDLDSENS